MPMTLEQKPVARAAPHSAVAGAATLTITQHRDTDTSQHLHGIKQSYPILKLHLQGLGLIQNSMLCLTLRH